MNIGLDFDDVIASTNALKPRIAQRLYGVEIDPARFRREFVVATGILTEEQFLTVSREAYSGRHPVDPVRNALIGIRSLLSYGHNLCIVTNRSDAGGTLSSAKDWLKEYDLLIPITGVPYGTSKAEACKGLDLFVDDDPVKLQGLVGVVPNLLFFCWAHNIHEKEPEEAIRVHSWQDIMFCVAQIVERREQ